MNIEIMLYAVFVEPKIKKPKRTIEASKANIIFDS